MDYFIQALMIFSLWDTQIAIEQEILTSRRVLVANGEHNIFLVIKETIYHHYFYL